jgi:hypothetical protein
VKAEPTNLLDASARVGVLKSSTKVEDFPQNERVARNLLPLKSDPEKLRAVWQKVQEQHPAQRITAPMVAESPGRFRFLLGLSNDRY